MTIEQSPTESPPRTVTPAERRRAAIEAIAWALENERARADAAELRRIRVESNAPLPAAFWRYLAAYAEPLVGHDRDTDERRWAVVFRTIAQLSGQHRASARVGGALANAGVQEPRMLRLLRARDESLFDQLRVLAHQLASKAVKVDVAALVELVFHADDARGEQLRRQIARDFYFYTVSPEE